MRILYTAPNLPYPTTSGGAQRTARLLESLRLLAEVDCVFLPAVMPATKELIKLKDQANVVAMDSTDRIRMEHSGPIISKLGKSIQTFWQGECHRWLPSYSCRALLPPLENYDLIVSRYLAPACILNLFEHPRLLIDVDDYDPDRLKMRINSASFLKNLTLKRCLQQSMRAHQKLLPQAQHIWVSNENDRQHIGLNHATLLPNLPYFRDKSLPVTAPQRLQSQQFLMVGTFDYSANATGADLFIREAWPRIIKHFPNAELILIGRGMSKKQQQRWRRNRGVHPLGFVKDLAGHYATAIATISPILAGGGTNIKVLESAAYARAPIITKIAHRGFEKDFIHNKSCLITANIEQMAAACINMLRTPETAFAMGLQARRVIEVNYTVPQFENSVHAACLSVLQSI